jgi:predicted PurR-regulated permease PerM
LPDTGTINMRVNGLTKGFFILILLMVSLAFFNVLSPYYSAILWAAILSVIFNPVKNKLRARLGERNGLASLLTVVIICLIVFTPLAIIISSLAIELNLVYTRLQHNDTQFPWWWPTCLPICRSGPEAFSPNITLTAQSRFRNSSLTPP